MTNPFNTPSFSNPLPLGCSYKTWNFSFNWLRGKHSVDVKANWWSGNHTPLNPSTNKKCEKQQLHSADDWQANLRVSFLIKGKYWFEQSTLQTQINNQTHNSFIFFPKSFKHCYLTLAALKILCHKQPYE